MKGRVFGSLAVLLLFGCGGEEPGKQLDVIPVTGSVTVDGKSVPGVSVTFVPQESTEGGGGYGGTDTSGKFSLKYRDGRDGVPAGKYKVLFSQMLKPDGTPLGPDEMAADAGAEDALPAIYRDPEGTPFTVLVSQGDSDFTFELKSK